MTTIEVFDGSGEDAIWGVRYRGEAGRAWLCVTESKHGKVTGGPIDKVPVRKMPLEEARQIAQDIIDSGNFPIAEAYKP